MIGPKHTTVFTGIVYNTIGRAAWPPRCAFAASFLNAPQNKYKTHVGRYNAFKESNESSVYFGSKQRRTQLDETVS